MTDNLPTATNEEGTQANNPENCTEQASASQPASADSAGREAPARHFVVGIGASAGGLDAIERFFDNVPPDCGLSFVLVQHLSPDFKSLMDELLARHTRMPIHRVKDGMVVEPNAVYLIPPKKSMALSEGRLLLTDQEQKSGLTMPIDVFLRSLAQDAGDRAIGVILSGSGSDGSRGVKDIHEAGGLVLVQSVETAAFDGMPRAAIATGMADCIVPPEHMPLKILQYVNHPTRLTARLAGHDSPREDDLGIVLSLLRRRFGVDFTLYKPGTIARRLERRMTMAGAAVLGEYVGRLEHDPDEVDALYRDLLVEVTQFFRDKEAFEVIKSKVIPTLCEQAAAVDEEELRVWVPGCATGEEAYSLAMLFHEHVDKQKLSLDVKIFASDVHKTSLDIAGTGIFSEQSVHEVPYYYLTRYFQQKRNRYHIAQEIRQMVIFAQHNLTKDPPFTKLDLISCRNVQIYFNPATQKKVLSLFQFGLRTGGVLFLGPSESVTELESEFETIDSHWKIYRKHRDVRLPFGATRLPSFQPLSDNALLIKQRLIGQPSNDDGMSEVYEMMLQQFVPPSLLLNEQHELLHAFGDARKFLRVPEGKATNDVLRMVEDGLRMAISSALFRSTKDNKAVTYGGVRTRVDGKDCLLKVTALPLSRRGRNKMHLVSLEPEETPVAPAAQSFDLQGEYSERLGQLERELNYTKEHLQSTIEELETSNEELQSTNEELVASNEELQSTNEELHSVNEELYTVNAEHQRKIEELIQLTNDMDNLLHSTDIGTLFLDGELLIRKFTPAVGRVFNLLPQDVGRPLRHISNNIRIPYDTLHGLIEEAYAGGSAVEQELSGLHGETYLMRILPYHTQNNTITGTVLTFVDVSSIKEAQRQLAGNERRLAIALEVGGICTWEWELQRNRVRTGSRFPPFFGVTLPELETSFDEVVALIHEEDRDRFRQAVERAVAGHERREVDYRIPLPTGETRYALTRVDVERDQAGKALRVIGVCIDVTDRRKMQAALQENKQLLQAIMDNSTALIYAKDLLGRFLFVNQALVRLLGLTSTESALGKTDFDLFPPTSAEELRRNDQKVLVTADVVETEEVLALADGPRCYFAVRFPLRNAAGEVYGVAGVAADITERRSAENEVRQALVRRDQFLAMLSHELRNPLGAILTATHVLQGTSTDETIRSEARQVIQRQALQMARLLDDLLDVSRIAQHKIQLQTETQVLNEILTEAAQSCQPLMDRAGVELQVELGEEKVFVRGDAVRLQQVAVNLLTNAAKYTPRGGKVQLLLATEDSDAIVSVRDTGIGIDADKLESIFDLFVQGHNTLDRTSGGLGVGLTLVRNLVELHGGNVVAVSAGPGHGSEFIVRLPRCDSVINGQHESESADVGPLQRLRVVLVEDNADSRRMFESLLRMEGFEVCVAGDGKAGLERIVEFKPALAFVDIGLPKMDGYQVARAVRARPELAGIHLVALTGYGRAEDHRAVMEAGFNEHLVKPLQRAELKRVLRAARSRGPAFEGAGVRGTKR